MLGGDKRAAFLARFNDQTAPRHTADNAVARRKVMLVRRRARRQFADDDSVFAYLLREFAMLARIDNVRSRADDGDSPRASGDGAFVRGGVNALRHSAGDDNARLRKRARKNFRIAHTRRRRAAASDNGDDVGIQNGCLLPASIKHKRRAGCVQELLRIILVRRGDQLILVALLSPAQRGFGGGFAFAVANAFGDILGNVRGEFGLRRVRRRARVAESVQQTPHQCRADAFGVHQRKQIIFR